MYNNLGDLIRFDKERTVYRGGGGGGCQKMKETYERDVYGLLTITECFYSA